MYLPPNKIQTPKVALCFLISYDHILNKEAVWREWIAQNPGLFNVYFHCTDSTKIKSAWMRKHALPANLIGKTTYFKVVPGYMAILSYAFFHDPANRWFCMLTDSCAPLMDPITFYDYFATNRDKSVMRWKPAYWPTDMHKRANLRFLSQELQLANDPWFVLTRDHVAKCLRFMKFKADAYGTICSGGLANESIFAIILKMYKKLDSDQVINSISTIADWVRMDSPTSPHCFMDASAKNLDVIVALRKESPDALFIRKIHWTFPDLMLRKIIYGENVPKMPTVSQFAKIVDFFARMPIIGTEYAVILFFFVLVLVQTI